MENKAITIASIHEAQSICDVLQSAYQAPRTVAQLQDYFGLDYTVLALKCDAIYTGVAIIHWILDEAEMIDLGIHADYQQQKLGTTLLNHVMAAAKAKKCGSLFLEVRQSNVNAIALYQKAGFEQIGLRKNYYPTSKNAYENALTLKISL